MKTPPTIIPLPAPVTCTGPDGPGGGAATGSVVGQIAKIKGCRAIGIAG